MPEEFDLSQPATGLPDIERAEADELADLGFEDPFVEPGAELSAPEPQPELEPELGATVVRLVQPGGPRVRVALEGPGVDGRLETSLPCSRPELEARDRACAGYPLGIDLVFLEPDGGIQALPRTTRVQTVEE